MLHPFMPFITEEIYTKLPNAGESIMISDYPKADKKYNFEKDGSYKDGWVDGKYYVRGYVQRDSIGFGGGAERRGGR